MHLQSLLALGIALALPLGGAPASPQESQIAYRVKVGFLFNFLRFADWPPSALPADQPFRLAVSADDATYAFIESTFAGKSVDHHAIIVERATLREDRPAPHLLFITRSAPPEMAQAARRYAGHPVLTIGETDGFARRGGILNFVQVDEAVRFEVNLAAAERAGLRISSRVSKMAILVRPEP